MKIGPNILKNFPAGILGVIFALLLVAPASAQILIVDVTNPAAVTFTATSAEPSGTVSGYSFYDGIDLVNFFTSSVSTGLSFAASPNTLTTDDASTGTFFDTGASTSSGSETGNPDLSLFKNDPGAPAMTFTAGDAALTGTLTLNLTGQPLPVAGTSHALVAGYTGGTTPIGSYLVVEAPEPSTWALFALGIIALLMVRGRRARA